MENNYGSLLVCFVGFPLLGLLENNLRIIYLKREDIRNKSAYYILILVISLILFLFSSFRSENVGADLVVYKIGIKPSPI